MEEINWEEFSIIHTKIRELFIFEISGNINQDAIRHIQRGFIMRFNMMESAIIKLYNEVGKSDEPLSSHLAVDLSLFLNAYYLNLTGSLENFAWALNYHLNLFSPVDEKAFGDQRKIQLINNDFLEALKTGGFQKLADELKKMEDWLKSVKGFRNPAAHNTPLFVPHTIYTENDLKKHKELDIEASQLIREGRDEDGRRLMYESYNLGKHYPVFITEFPKTEIYSLPKQINEDHQNWLKMTQLIFELGFGARGN